MSEINWAADTAVAAWQVLGYGRSFAEGESRVGFNVGARWQRNQLRTDEDVERVAMAIGEWAIEDWDSPDFAEEREFWKDKARTAINALIGEEPRP